MNRFRDNYEAPGLLRTIAQWMNEVGRFLNGINVVGNGHIEENARGSVTITVGRAGLSGGESSPFEYRSYFRVIDASTYDENGTITLCKIGVTDGRTTVSGSCGTVKINGARANVTAVEETLSSDGVYYVWIHSWLDASLGPQAEIRLGDAGVSVPPENPNGGLRHGSKLAGRVTVEDGKITDIVQDYLSGGEHTEIMMGNCDGLLIMCGQGGAQT